jgi:hypothetical protein
MTREEEVLIYHLERLRGRRLTPCERRLSLTQAWHIGELSEEPTHEASFDMMKLYAEVYG